MGKKPVSSPGKRRGSSAEKGGTSAEAEAGGSPQLPDYTVYVLTPLSRMLAMLAGGLLLFGIGYLFYHNLLLSLLLVPGELMHRGCCVITCGSAAGLRLTCNSSKPYFRSLLRCPPDVP